MNSQLNESTPELANVYSPDIPQSEIMQRKFV